MHTKTKSIDEHRLNFPALTNKTYFNYGAQGVLSTQAMTAVMDSFKTVQSIGPFNSKMFAWLHDEIKTTKESFASELGGKPHLYALTQNATEGCNIFLWGIEWQEGDHLLLTDSEHFGVVASAKQLARRRNVELTYFSARGSAQETLDNMTRALTAKTRLVVASQVLWNTGAKLPIEDMQEICRARSILLLVDGAQSAGVIPLNLEHLNFDGFALPGHKWLGGPEGVGVLYVSEQSLTRVAPTFVGWRSVQYELDGAIGDFEPDATRFEAATAPCPLFAGVRKAISLHQQWGTPQERYERVRQLTQRLHDGISQNPEFTILTPSPVPAGLLSFTSKSRSHGDLVRSLEERHIMVRSIPSPECIRVSVHYLSTEKEIDDLIAALS